MNLMYKYPTWFNQKIYIYAVMAGVLFHSFPYLFGKGGVELSALLTMTLFWIGAVIIYVLANRNESSSVSITVKGVVVQKQLLQWSEIENVEQATDGDDGVLLMIPILGTKLGTCLKIITKDGGEYFIYKALNNYRECIDKINERLDKKRN